MIFSFRSFSEPVKLSAFALASLLGLSACDDYYASVGTGGVDSSIRVVGYSGYYGSGYYGSGYYGSYPGYYRSYPSYYYRSYPRYYYRSYPRYYRGGSYYYRNYSGTRRNEWHGRSRGNSNVHHSRGHSGGAHFRGHSRGGHRRADLNLPQNEIMAYASNTEIANTAQVELKFEEMFAQRFELSANSAKTFLEAMEKSQRGNKASLQRLGFETKDVEMLARFELPSQPSIERLARNLDQYPGNTRAMLKTLVETSQQTLKAQCAQPKQDRRLQKICAEARL